MIRIVTAALFAVLFATTASAQRQPVPIVNHPDMAIATHSGKPLALEAVSKAIEAGAQAASNGPEKWTVGRVAPDRLRLLCTVRNKHTITVDVRYTGNSYSVMYDSSTNMKYEVLNGQPVIHPFYNRWVDALIRSINAEFMKL